MNELPIRARAIVVPDIADISSEEMGDEGEVIGDVCGSEPREGLATCTTGWPIRLFGGATSGIEIGAGIDFFKA